MFELRLLEILAALGASHLAITALVRSLLTFSARCELTAVDMQDLPKNVARAFQQRQPELAGIGFDRIDLYDCGSIVPETHTYIAYFCNRETNDFANVTARVTRAGCSSYMEFSTSFANGVVVETNTNATLPLTPGMPERRVFRFPGTQKPQELYRIHRQLVEKYAPGLWGESAPRGEEIERYKRIIDNYGPRHTRIGYMRLVDGNQFKLTWKGAFLVTLRKIWPIALVRKVIQRHAMQIELQRLQAKDIAALQKA